MANLPETFFAIGRRRIPVRCPKDSRRYYLNLYKYIYVEYVKGILNPHGNLS